MPHADVSDLRARFEEAGQGHVLQHLDELSGEERDRFLEQLEGVDLDWVQKRYGQYQAEKNRECVQADLEPAPVTPLPDSPEQAAREAEARAAGDAALAQGRMAAFLVAGGQGTRLGFDGPKGAFPIGPVTDRTLFQYHAEQIRARARRCGAAIPWYIMTSDANDAATRAFFREHDHFGFDPDDISFFRQDMVPAVDFDGKLILEAPGRLAMNPNGHGGSIFALVRSGATRDMRRRGIDTISYFQVDNPLVTICDPVFAGYHLQAGAGMSSKVLAKRDPGEKVGAVCYIDGTLGVVEYSDLPEEEMYARDADGRLKHWAGSIAIHMLDVDFVDRVGSGAGQLPWHCAFKKIPYYDAARGETVKPEEPNGVKFETFVFDALPLTDATVTMEVAREEEFAPVKNPAGQDSPESCRTLLSNRAGRMLDACGVQVPADAHGNVDARIELSALYALDTEELKTKASAELVIEPGSEVVLAP
jgi:UDP-N-acetylglucosamine/UDP-N-acetylgalactosamine diphosphorylase